MPLAQLITEARDGSTVALGQLLQHFRVYLLQVARAELQKDLQAKLSDADLVQQTFLEAQLDFTKFQGRRSEELLAWLKCILLNNVANANRHFRATGKRQVGREVSLGKDS